MTENEAIYLLAACRPLAAKLAAEGFDYKLTPEERATLDGYRRVREAGLANLDRVRRQAGLFQFDLVMLSTTLASLEPQAFDSE